MVQSHRRHVIVKALVHMHVLVFVTKETEIININFVSISDVWGQSKVWDGGLAQFGVPHTQGATS